MTNESSFLAAYFFAKMSSTSLPHVAVCFYFVFFRVPELPLHVLGRPRRGGGQLCRVSWRDGVEPLEA